MGNIELLGIELFTLAILTCLNPVRKWWHDLLNERYLLTFLLLITILFCWPLDRFDAFQEGQELGGQRIARIIILLIFWGAFFFCAIWKKNFAFPRMAALHVFFLYAILCAFSAFWSSEPLQTLWKSFELFVLLSVAIHLYQNRGNPVLRARRIANSLMYILFALCVMSIIGGFLDPERAWLDWGTEGLGIRSMAGVVPMLNANMLGQIGGIVAAVGVGRLILDSKLRQKGDYLVFLVGLTTLILAYSRTSIIAFIVVTLFIIIAFRRINWLVAMLLFVVAVAPLLGDGFLGYLSRGQDADQFTTLSGRTYMWNASLKAFADRPWFGHGYFIGHKYVLVEETGYQLTTVDSTYIETLVNLGLVGFFLISLFAALTGIKAVRVLFTAFHYHLEYRETILILFVIVGFILVRSLTATSFQSLHLNLILLLFALIALHFIEYKRVDGRSHP